MKQQSQEHIDKEIAREAKIAARADVIWQEWVKERAPGKTFSDAEGQAHAEENDYQMDFERRICDRLNERGWAASYEYPGYICVRGKVSCWNIGTANPEWGMDLATDDGDQITSFGLGLLASERDREKIIAAIVSKLELGYQDAPLKFAKSLGMLIEAQELLQAAVVIVENSDGADAHAEWFARARYALNLTPAPEAKPEKFSPRFVWNIGSAQEAFPDLPEQGADSVLWDRQEKKAVFTVHGVYGQLWCLEHKVAPLSDLAEWVNGMTNSDLASEGIPVTR